jgi:serine/alanine adding enzyme
MGVFLYTDEDRRNWEQFVLIHPECSLYHNLGWKEIIEKSYGHKCFYLLAKEDEKLKGILPLVLVKSKLFGSSLTSLPFLDSAGVVAEDFKSSQVLLNEAIELGKFYQVDYLELRQIKALEGDMKTDTHKITLTLKLNAELEMLWKSLPSERRNRIRKAQENNLSVEFGDSNFLSIFYNIWAENMRDLGSPAHSLQFFHNILRVFTPFAKVILVKYNQIYIGSAICFFFKNKFSIPWVSSLREYFDLYPNNLLYWEAMKFAINQNCQVFDFGRSSIGSGTYTFKMRWGASQEPLFWQFKIYRGKDLTLPLQESLKYRLAISLWKRVPINLTKLIGPKIRKYITA